MLQLNTNKYEFEKIIDIFCINTVTISLSSH